MPFPSTVQPLIPPLLDIQSKIAVRQIVWLLSGICGVDAKDKVFGDSNYCFLKLSKSLWVLSSV